MQGRGSIQKAFQRSSLGWQQSYLKIVNKSSQLIPLAHNIAQLKVHNTLQLQKRQGLPVRAIVLKARQFGISTYIEADSFEDTYRRQNRHACVVSADKDSTDKVFKMCRTYLEELPKEMKRPIKHSNRKEIEYAAPHRSSILCQTAGKDVLGRGGTTHKVHATEVAFWAHAEQQMLGLVQEVPKNRDAIADTSVVLESTACGVGGFFHDTYWDAIKRLKVNSEDLNGYLPIFLPWYIFPEYQMPLPNWMQGTLQLINDEPYCEQDTIDYYRSFGVHLTPEQLFWRRYTINTDCGGDLGKFRQEYPGTAREAFQSTGKMIFVPALLDKYESKCCEPMAKVEFRKVESSVRYSNILRSYDCWRIWKWPEHNHEYILFGDVCEGILADRNNPKSDPDSHFAGILDRNTLEVVATFHGQCDTIPYGVQLVLGGTFYNWAWASPEINSCGLAVLNEFKRADYPKIYQRLGKDEEIVEQETAKLGYKTTMLNRKPGIEALKQVLKEQDITIYDKEIVDELRVFVYKNGRPEAETGYHDDAVMMMVGLIQLHLLCPMGDSLIEQQTTSDRGYDDDQYGNQQLAIAGACDVDIDDDLDGEEDYEDWE